MANPLAKDSILYIYCDGPKTATNSIEIEKINAVRTFVKSKNWCKETYVIEAETNLGCAPSIVKGVTEVIKKHYKIIVLEDDLILSPFFLDFMNDALNLYENHPKVSSIGACNFFANGDKYPKSFFLPYPDCLGWATWKYRWDFYEYNAEKLLQQLKSKKLIKKFNSNGAFDMEGLLVAQINNEVSAWDVQWTATCILNNWLTLYPNESISQHHYYEDATHSTFNVLPPLLQHKIVLKEQEVTMLPQVLQAMRLGYQGKGDFYGNKIPVKINKAYLIGHYGNFKNRLKRTVKKLLRPIVPKFLVKMAKKLNTPTDPAWFVPYQSWAEAQKASTGYDAQNILEKCKVSLLKVRDGEATYERDSVLFDEIQYSWGLLAGLQKAAIDNNGELCVIDFGGSLGSSYFQNRDFLKNLKSLKWCIIEQPHFVKCGMENFENDQLKFYYTLEGCLKENSPNVLLLSSVIQYLEKPYDWIEKFISYNIPYIILDRTAFTEHQEDIVCLQSVPDYIYKASYPCWFFEPKHLTAQFTKGYQSIGKFDSGYTTAMDLDGKKFYWDGLILKK
jgi:putative methyltransferase (TIGR04325 family)